MKDSKLLRSLSCFLVSLESITQSTSNWEFFRVVDFITLRVYLGRVEMLGFRDTSNVLFAVRVTILV